MIIIMTLLSAEFTVEESQVLDESFGTVSASDTDDLGDIRYRLSTTSTVFQIDNSTGDLSLIQTLDFETT